MTSSRLILILLGIIFLVIVMLSSGKIAGTLRERFASFIPNIRPAEEITPSPTHFQEETPTPTPTVIYGSSTETSEIPATGPNEIVWLVLGSSMVAGLSLKKFSSKGGQVSIKR